MSGTAPYEVNVTGTDDEAYSFTLSFEVADGTAFPFEDYEIEYVVREGGGTKLSLSQSNGISIAAPAVSFDAGNSPLRRGEYEHGCRARHIASGKYFQIFNGSVRIGEGEF